MICVYSEHRIKEAVCIISLTTSILLWSFASSLLCLVIVTRSLIKGATVKTLRLNFLFFSSCWYNTVFLYQSEHKIHEHVKGHWYFVLIKDFRPTLPLTQKTGQVGFFEHTAETWILAPDLKSLGTCCKKSFFHLTEGSLLNQFNHTTANPCGQY